MGTVEVLEWAEHAHAEIGIEGIKAWIEQVRATRVAARAAGHGLAAGAFPFVGALLLPGGASTGARATLHNPCVPPARCRRSLRLRLALATSVAVALATAAAAVASERLCPNRAGPVQITALQNDSFHAFAQARR